MGDDALNLAIQLLDLVPVETEDQRAAKILMDGLSQCRSLGQLKAWWSRNSPAVKLLPSHDQQQIIDKKDSLKATLR